MMSEYISPRSQPSCIQGSRAQCLGDANPVISYGNLIWEVDLLRQFLKQRLKLLTVLTRNGEIGAYSKLQLAQLGVEVVVVEVV